MSGSGSKGAVVVGGASGIGAAVAARQRAAGVTTVVWDIRGDPDIACDITQTAAVEAATAATIERIGVPAIVTVCAGIGHSGTLLEVDPDEFDRVLTVNAKGPLLAMRALARSMIAAGVAGSFVATSSVSARIADRSMGVYCASKAALSMLVKVAAAEWAASGLRVNAVSPGVTDTPMLGGAPLGTGWLAHVADRTALGRIGTPDDIAEAILAVHEMSWVTGQALECDGGLGLHSPINSYGEQARRRP